MFIHKKKKLTIPITWPRIRNDKTAERIIAVFSITHWVSILISFILWQYHQKRVQTYHGTDARRKQFRQLDQNRAGRSALARRWLLLVTSVDTNRYRKLSADIFWEKTSIYNVVSRIRKKTLKKKNNKKIGFSTDISVNFEISLRFTISNTG